MTHLIHGLSDSVAAQEKNLDLFLGRMRSALSTAPPNVDLFTLQRCLVEYGLEAQASLTNMRLIALRYEVSGFRARGQGIDDFLDLEKQLKDAADEVERKYKGGT